MENEKKDSKKHKSYFIGGGILGGLLLGGAIAYQVQQGKINSINNEHDAVVEQTKDIARETVRKLDNELKSTKREYNKISTSLSEVESKYRTVSANLNNLRNEYENVLYLNDSLVNRNETISLELDKSTSVADSLVNRLDDVVTSLKHSQDSISSYQNKVLDLKDVNSANRDTIHKFQIRMHEENIPGWFQSASSLNRDVLNELPRNFYETRQDKKDARKLYRILNRE